jgi:hypothetical protein
MVESNYYNYGIKHILSKDIETINTPDQYVNIVLCVYSINTNGKVPFLQYLLINNGCEVLTLPKLPVYTSFNKGSLIPYSVVYLSGILQANQFEKFSNDISFDGFYEYNDDLYLFFDITKCQINIDETYLSNHVRFGLIDEIINHKNICNIQIDYNTSVFFIKNESITYLYDEENKPYEVPVVGFVGKQTEKKINFTMIFGESAKDKSAIVGPYFYFTSFHRAIRQGGWSHDYKPETKYAILITDENGKYKKGGIIRFALFVGKTKYIENAPNDPTDESEIKKQRLEDNNLDKKKEIQTLRISDHDGIWSKTYDSVYLGKLELDDGSFLEDTPMLVLRDYEQQVPISCHFIDKSTLGDKYDENNCRYSIV